MPSNGWAFTGQPSSDSTCLITACRASTSTRSTVPTRPSRSTRAFGDGWSSVVSDRLSVLLRRLHSSGPRTENREPFFGQGEREPHRSLAGRVWRAYPEFDGNAAAGHTLGIDGAGRTGAGGGPGAIDRPGAPTRPAGLAGLLGHVRSAGRGACRQPDAVEARPPGLEDPVPAATPPIGCS